MGVIFIMSSPAIQCCSSPSPRERKTWLKGALSSVLDRFRYFSCFIETSVHFAGSPPVAAFPHH